MSEDVCPCATCKGERLHKVVEAKQRRLDRLITLAGHYTTGLLAEQENEPAMDKLIEWATAYAIAQLAALEAAEAGRG